MKDRKLILQSFASALGVLIYVLIVTQILQNVQSWFVKNASNAILGPVAILMLFTLSAAVVGGLILGKPIYLFFSGQKQESVKMFLYTVGWLFVLTFFVFLILVII